MAQWCHALHHRAPTLALTQSLPQVRTGSLVYMFYLGVFSKDAVYNLVSSVEDPMRPITFLQSFIVTYYMINSWSTAPYTLKKA